VRRYVKDSIVMPEAEFEALRLQNGVWGYLPGDGFEIGMLSLQQRLLERSSLISLRTVVIESPCM
jgi:hypothetical protein